MADIVDVTDLDSYANASIHIAHSTRLDRYLRLKAIGIPSRAALISSFGTQVGNHMLSHSYIDLIETSDAYINGLPKYVAAMKDHAIWSPAISARALVAIVNDQGVKTSDRMSAIKELNVIFNITIIDENGKTRAGSMSLADLERVTPSMPAAGVKVH